MAIKIPTEKESQMSILLANPNTRIFLESKDSFKTNYISKAILSYLRES